MVYISLREFTTWLDVTVFELWIHFASILVSSVLLFLKLHNIMTISYQLVAAPIFIGIGFVAYFIFIIYMRSCVEYKDYRGPTLKVVFNMIRLTLLTSFLYLLINKISGELENSEVANQNTYSFIFTPIWILLFLWCAQICRATSS
ncbi:hypothetical protein L5515_012880 [Caenorhabditis briggsae]|uniref:Uncharacterized protein n=1 Tax=Caenorhabditis briggsae TaxID=6238 RepID=A0AAE9JJR2_CAEBR|nr:hypothetical protein L3Y34_005795 [Caenorhabditis briggsae]UMM31381.1 hypothetical protein L5515_012880 [Caenorhabditis briggsae]